MLVSCRKWLVLSLSEDRVSMIFQKEFSFCFYETKTLKTELSFKKNSEVNKLCVYHLLCTVLL